MFRATTLSGFVVYGSQRSECSFIIWFGNFAVQDSMYYPRGRIAVAYRAILDRAKEIQTTSGDEHYFLNASVLAALSSDLRQLRRGKNEHPKSVGPARLAFGPFQSFPDLRCWVFSNTKNESVFPQGGIQHQKP
jgi:hypothetical protein